VATVIFSNGNKSNKCVMHIEFSSLFYLPNFLRKKIKLKCTVSKYGSGGFVLPLLVAQMLMPF
jgi:hypothetical protein